jgi:photosystem II stability/assembly factor-like uncharacterized protein
LTNHQIIDISRLWVNRGGQKKEDGMARGGKRQIKAKAKVKSRRKQDMHPAFSRFKKWVFALFCFGLAFLQPICTYAENIMIWEKSDHGISDVKIKSVCIIQEQPNIIFSGSDNGIYRSDDFGKSWVMSLLLTGEKRGVNFISYSPDNPSIIYAATSDGLYISQDSGKAWSRQFRGRDQSQRDISRVAVSRAAGTVFIGTQRGLFKSIDYGRHWSSEDYFTNKAIRSIAMGEGFYYACTDDGVYFQRQPGSNWDKVYNLISYSEETEQGEDEDNDFEQEENFIALNAIAISKDNVYIATDNGILLSSIGGGNWARMTSEGLKSKKIDCIVADEKHMFISSQKGIFQFDREKGIWLDCLSGITTLNINMIDLSFENGLAFAATEKGLFRAYTNSDANGIGSKHQANLFSGEPGISDIHQAAIEYSEVSPDKIKWMRQAAKNQALIPEFSVNLDRDISRNINLDRGGTSDPDFFIEGPRDKKWSWGIGLNWDLSELVWSYHQTSIDVRSRLMVQLRNDILDEVTKLYFERLRLKHEIEQMPAKEKNQINLKQLRLAELTANIDALTGGYLSRTINKTKDSY